LAILDQAVYALTNLALQVIVARSISQEEFGAYSVGSAFFFVAALVHASFIIEPMFVFTAERYSDCVGAYHKRLRREGSILFSVTTVVVGLVLAWVMWIAGSLPVAKTLAAFAIVSPLLLYLWLLRRMAFLLGRIELAVLGGAVYSFSLFCGAALVSKFGVMTANAAVGLSGVAAIVGSVIAAGVISWTASETKPPKDMVYQHFRYGRWSASSEAVSLVISNGPIVVLPIWHGLVAAAQVRILNLIFMPVLQVVVPMAYLLLRRFASTVRQGEEAQKAVGFVRFVGGGSWRVLRSGRCFGRQPGRAYIRTGTLGGGALVNASCRHYNLLGRGPGFLRAFAGS
jgi:O-antigen/teichoic acid export membrane protein